MVKKKNGKKVKFSPEQIISKIEKTITPAEIERLADLSVLQNSDGSYSLYNKYIIKKINGKYLVTRPELAESNTYFYVLKHAVTWCTYDKRNRIMDSKRIQDLDNRLTSIESSIAIHQNLSKKTKDIDNKLIYLAKLGEEKIQRSIIAQELDRYVSESKYWQAKRFNTKP